MWAGICYGSAFCFAALSILASHFPSRGRRSALSSPTVGFPGALMAVTAILVLLGAFLGVRFGAFYRNHWSGVDAGGLWKPDEDQLFQYRVMLFLLCLGTAVDMARHRMMCARVGLCGLAGAATAASAAKAFIMSIPQRGDEGLLLWLFLIPLFKAAALALIIYSVVYMVTGLYRLARRAPNKSNTGMAQASPCPGESASPTTSTKSALRDPFSS